MAVATYIVIVVQLVLGSPKITVASKPVPMELCLTVASKLRPAYEGQGNLLALGCATQEATAQLQSKF